MKVKEISNEIAELLEKKNRDYGNSFDKTIAEYGITAYLLRIEDKISRLKSITKNKEVLVTDESMEDTIRDIAGYSILMLNYLESKNK
jgi:predicted SpoU family rRNA methylase